MRKIRMWGPGLLLVSPSIILIAVFVYGLIGWNVKVSLSDWRQAQHTTKWAGLAAYRDLNSDPAWTENLNHILTFTATFIIGTLIVGLALAFLPLGLGDVQDGDAGRLGPRRLHHGALPGGVPRRAGGAARGGAYRRRVRVPRLPPRRLPAPAARHARRVDHPRSHLDQGLRPDRRDRRQAARDPGACRLHVDPDLRRS